VQAGRVVPANVLDDGEFELRAGPLGAIGDQFSLEAVDERLGERVVVDVAGRANRGEHPVVGERLGVVDARAASLNQSLVSFKYGLPSHSFPEGDRPVGRCARFSRARSVSPWTYPTR
jgi:hypothetical protein